MKNKSLLVVVLMLVFCTTAHADKLKDVTPDQIGDNITTGIKAVGHFNYVDAIANGVGGTVTFTLKTVGAVVTAPFKLLEKVRK